MRRRKYAHVRPEHDAIPDGHEPAVEDREVEVCVEAVAEADVAAVVDGERGLDEGLVALDVADYVAKEGETVLLEGGEVGGTGGEGVVVVVAPDAGFEACGGEFGGEGVVTVPKWYTLSTRTLAGGLCSFFCGIEAHSMPDIILSYCLLQGMWLSLRASANCSESFSVAAMFEVNVDRRSCCQNEQDRSCTGKYLEL